VRYKDLIMAGGTNRQISGPAAEAGLGDRARRILASIVRDHIHGGVPIGSSAIAQEIDCSSATVRAVMADLEALGYLEKPHTSAGRVPTAKGYRYYVDALLHLRVPPAAEREMIEKRTHDAAARVDGLFAEASRMLHALTRHAGVVAAPRAQSERLRQIELVPLREGRVLVVLVSRAGRVQNRLLALPRAWMHGELIEAQNYLNGLLAELTLEEARVRIASEMERDRRELNGLRERALSLGALAVQLDEPAIHLDGQETFLEEPGIAHDVAKMRALFKALSERERLLSVLDRTLAAQELTIFIGAESGIQEPELAIVAAPYRRAGEIVGALGVIGPTRMDYSRVIPLVEFTARAVGLALDPPDGEERG
jgi:heat-inducible transcriptional repressor